MTEKQFVHRSIKLYPTYEQKEYLDRCIQLYRFVYNWTIEQKEARMKEFDLGKSDTSYISEKELKEKFIILRKENVWLQEVPAHLLRFAITDVIDAYEAFFNKRSKRPKFKSRKYSKQSFSTSATKNVLYFFEDKVHIEGLKGYRSGILTKYDSGYKTGAENPSNRYNARIILNNRGEYILSYYDLIDKSDYQQKIPDNIKYDRAIGIDVNAKNYIATSYENGEKIYAPNVDKEIKKLKKLSRRHEKDVARYKKQKRTNSGNCELEKSKNYIKRQIKLAKQYYRVQCIYDYFIRTTVKSIVKRNPKAIVIEDLDLVYMRSQKSKKHIRKALGTFTNFSKIRRCVIENCNKFNVPLIIADKYYPSTKRCSNCGHKQTVKGSKTYKCPKCGMVMDRDINAAINLEQLAYLY